MRPPLDLLTTLVRQQHLSASRAKDIKTSLLKLAAAAGTDPDDLDLAALEPTYLDTLRTYFTERSPGASAYTQRNTVQNLKQFYRLLHTHGFLKHAIRRPAKRPRVRAMKLEAGQTSPYRHRFADLPGYRCPVEQWPPEMREGWQRFCDDRGIDIRPVTLKAYQGRLEVYVGYNLRFDRSPTTSWGDLFDGARLLRFITWHAQRMRAKRISAMGRQVFRVITMLARHAERPEYASLLARERKLPAVEPMHNKQSPEHTISAKELEDIAITLLAEAEKPLHPHWDGITQRRGLMRAGKRRDALMLRLMWRVPMRSRSVCEMELGKNLIKDHEGRWVLEYRGEQLKVAQRGGRINTFRVPFPPELVDHLEAYLGKARPIFPNAETDAHVFLTQRGRPFTAMTLRQLLSDTVYFYTRKRLYPHLLRTLWVDQYLLSTGDVSTAAFWLNDNVITVLKRYHELRGEDHTVKAFAFNQLILGNGKGTSRAPRV
jgi:site-specific recombinase XerD